MCELLVWLAEADAQRSSRPSVGGCLGDEDSEEPGDQRPAECTSCEQYAVWLAGTFDELPGSAPLAGGLGHGLLKEAATVCSRHCEG